MKPLLLALIAAAILLSQIGMGMEDENQTLFNYTWEQYFKGIEEEGIMEGCGHENVSCLYLPEKQELEFILAGYNATAEVFDFGASSICFAILDRYNDDLFVDTPQEVVNRTLNTAVIVGKLDGEPFMIGKRNGIEGIFFIENKSIAPKIVSFCPKILWQRYWFLLGHNRHSHVSMWAE